MILDGIDYGHNCAPDIGASGWIQEDDGTRNIGSLVVAGLDTTPGHQGACVTPLGETFSSVIGSLAKRCQIANSLGVNRYVSIHMNASNGQGHGVEIFANSDAAKQIAEPILSNLVALGFTNRGIKSENLYVLRNTVAPAILIEICFCDSEVDHAIYNEQNIATAIIRGLTGQNAVSIPIPTPITKQAFGTTWNKDYASLQHLLNVQGFRDRNNNLLAEDGFPGALTLSAASKCIVKHGGQGDITKWIQCKLGITADGIFGTQTLITVQDFQNSNGLQPDGIVGQNTWRKLLGL
ncbi:N-acetylmuramoyl-L-alanine amidase [Clostridium magnum]|uniref:Sporulation-specific N-acetylmuramoyl-L-alanine amidase n=1 Tax=Clostridium magnum DSM 2767 TaxID=1121326 RepID=A0A161WQ42_9CLOT|nr:N-acetylmuramoyl-L-alanine amidase [Clostridium magnum]KZL88728.1 sporulation-specific N-acetylmuramoyl-L-alanine amidase [Clostridium magnum DSM 2767]SHJ65924.1 N-acetylmuramoyl-L-alanine amidase [Clostridium magnum DSM 2767]